MKNYFTLFSAQTRLLLLVPAILFVMIAGATTHTVQVANFSFTPSMVNATVGDTIVWQWVSGMHTTTSLGIPAGAASWNAPMNSSSQTFSYVLTVPGTYNYNCTMHPSVMTGTINVTATNINEVANAIGISVYPNPSHGQVEIRASEIIQHIEVYDILGHLVEAKEVNADNTSLDLSHQAKGIYLLSIATENETVVKKVIIGN